MFTLSGVLANFQPDNYFLPVKMIPLQSELTGAFIYPFISPHFQLTSVVRLVLISRGQMLPAPCGMNFCKHSLLPWEYFLDPQILKVVCYIIPNSASLLVNILELLEDNIYYFLKIMPLLSLTSSHAWKHIQYSTAFLHNFVNTYVGMPG